MKIEMAYGREGLKIDLPETADVLEPKYTPRLQNLEEEILRSLRYPIHSKSLQDLVSPDSRVAIVHTDTTRATPNQIILPPLLRELELVGVHRENIILITGLGTHRRQSEQETRKLLGDFIFDRYRCIQHDPEDLIQLKTIHDDSGKEYLLNRAYLEADIRILTGFIEPHFFAGFSGGPKAVLPGIAGKSSIIENHGPAMVSHPKANWGITDGNPIWEEINRVAHLTRPSFILNVTLNAKKEITAVFAGDLRTAHKLGCDRVKESSMIEVDHPYDIVVTTNSGYPLDQNLYQSVKGICAAENIVKQGGNIIIASACEKGLPKDSNYAKILSDNNSIEDARVMLSRTGPVVQEQWQVHKQISVQQKAVVYVYSDGLSNDEIRQALFIPCQTIEGVIQELMDIYGTQVRICALPQGPQTIPYLKASI